MVNASRQGMVLGLRVLNRVYNFMHVCPKQGEVSTIILVKIIWFIQYLAILDQRRLLALIETL